MAEHALNSDLVPRAATGDNVALTLLLKATRRRLVGFVARRVPRWLTGLIDPEDVVQEAHAFVFKHWDRFRVAGEDSFFRWVATIALRKLRDTVRRYRACKRGGDVQVCSLTQSSPNDSAVVLHSLLMADEKSPSRVMAHAEAVKATLAELEFLLEEQRMAVRLVHLENMTVSQAAAVMQKTDGAVHGLCQRGLRTLRERMGSRSMYLSSTG